MSFFANKYAVYAAVLVSLAAGFFIWLKVHDHSLIKDASAAQNAAVAASVSEGQQREAKKWIAAYNAAQEAKTHVDESLKGYQATNDELLRHIDRMRHTPVHAPAVSRPGSDPGQPAYDPPSASLLAGPIIEDAIQCAFEYAQVATELEAIKHLKSSSVAH